MSKKSIALLALLILFPIVLYVLRPSDEGRIKKLFREGARAVEAGRVEDVMSLVSYNYADEYGLSYLGLKQGFERTFKEMAGIQVEYEIKDISIKDKNATAALDVRVIATHGQDTGYFVGDAARPAHLKFSLEKERMKWLISSVEGLRLDF
jgi:hypothetical protein